MVRDDNGMELFYNRMNELLTIHIHPFWEIVLIIVYITHSFRLEYARMRFQDKYNTSDIRYLSM